MAIPVSVLNDADCVEVLTIEEAGRLPGLLGRIAPAMMRLHGWYSCFHNGMDMLYVLPDANVQMED